MSSIFNIRVLESLKILTPDELERMVSDGQLDERVPLTEVMTSFLDNPKVVHDDSLDAYKKELRRLKAEEEERTKEEEERKKKENKFEAISEEERNLKCFKQHYFSLMPKTALTMPKKELVINFDLGKVQSEDDMDMGSTSMTDFIMSEKEKMGNCQKKLKEMEIKSLYKKSQAKNASKGSQLDINGILVNKKQH